MLSTSLPSYLWGDVLTTAHLINRMPSRVLHLQTPFECLKESYPSTRLISDVPLRVFRYIAYVYNHGSNPSKFTPRAHACVFVGYPLHQRGYKCVHPLAIFREREDLRKEVRSPANQPASVQDFEPLRDQGMTDSIDSHIATKMSEHDRFEAAIPEKTSEQGNVDREVILNEKSSNDKNEVSARATKNEIREDRSENISKFDSSLNLPIALKKGTRSWTKHFIANYISYDNLSPQFKAFTTNLDSTMIPKNIHIALDYPEWKKVVMEEMRALEQNKT
ncbi:reverse transcriptase [Cucumis melo var. makuwa]|uniref:Reverse transcriptase n=1 Tax=Cucumis melo var. makuwa TaxID=1194695 RepID=A0A5D3CFK9_CUCMM|nr:reverse transcriptase [Cucumis melo var. makuwa]TYK10275.1 reverse transcriptase [Cucumis melo var. makuwa]